MMKSIMAAAAVLSLAASPAVAASANPAASLSVAKSVRAGSSAGSSNKLAGGGAGIFALAIVAGIAAILIVDGTKDNSDSN